MKTALLSLTVALVVTGSVQVQAQERTAGSSMEVQASWTALKGLVEQANATSEAVNARVDQIIVCNKEMKLYAPGVEGVDSRGCLELPFQKETEYVESAGWQRPSYTLACTKGRKITMAMGNVTTNPNQLACNRTGSGCDFNATASLKGQLKWDVQVDSGKYVASFIECK